LRLLPAALAVVALADPLAAQQDAMPAPIADNSFLI
jgi:hypothetical protein